MTDQIIIATGKSKVVFYLEKGEAQIVLKQDTANTPHITGLAPSEL